MAENLEAGVRSIASYPLSPLQSGMLAQKAEGAGINITQVICSLPERIDPERMQAAWQQVVDRHDVLRTSFFWNEQEEARQRVNTAATVPFHWAGWWKEIDALVQKERKAGFDLAHPPLMRVALAQLGEEDFRLIWTFHHLIIDGRSIGLLLNEVFAIYEASGSGSPASLPPAAPYRNFIEWLQDRDSSGAESFWRKQLKSFFSPTTLPVASGAQALAAGTREQELKIEAPTLANWRRFADENGVTLN